jgi:hypothetical protein
MRYRVALVSVRVAHSYAVTVRQVFRLPTLHIGCKVRLVCLGLGVVLRGRTRWSDGQYYSTGSVECSPQLKLRGACAMLSR